MDVRIRTCRAPYSFIQFIRHHWLVFITNRKNKDHFVIRWTIFSASDDMDVHSQSSVSGQTRGTRAKKRFANPFKCLSGLLCTIGSKKRRTPPRAPFKEQAANTGPFCFAGPTVPVPVPFNIKTEPIPEGKEPRGRAKPTAYYRGQPLQAGLKAKTTRRKATMHKKSTHLLPAKYRNIYTVAKVPDPIRARQQRRLDRIRSIGDTVQSQIKAVQESIASKVSLLFRSLFG